MLQVLTEKRHPVYCGSIPQYAPPKSQLNIEKRITALLSKMMDEAKIKRLKDKRKRRKEIWNTVFTRIHKVCQSALYTIKILEERAKIVKEGGWIISEEREVRNIPFCKPGNCGKTKARYLSINYIKYQKGNISRFDGSCEVRNRKDQYCMRPMLYVFDDNWSDRYEEMIDTLKVYNPYTETETEKFKQQFTFLKETIAMDDESPFLPLGNITDCYIPDSDEEIEEGTCAYIASCCDCKGLDISCVRSCVCPSEEECNCHLPKCDECGEPWDRFEYPIINSIRIRTNYYSDDEWESDEDILVDHMEAELDVDLPESEPIFESDGEGEFCYVVERISEDELLEEFVSYKRNYYYDPAFTKCDKSKYTQKIEGESPEDGVEIIQYKSMMRSEIEAHKKTTKQVDDEGLTTEIKVEYYDDEGLAETVKLYKDKDDPKIIHREWSVHVDNTSYGLGSIITKMKSITGRGKRASSSSMTSLKVTKDYGNRQYELEMDSRGNVIVDVESYKKSLKNHTIGFKAIKGADDVKLLAVLAIPKDAQVASNSHSAGKIRTNKLTPVRFYEVEESLKGNKINYTLKNTDLDEGYACIFKQKRKFKYYLNVEIELKGKEFDGDMREICTRGLHYCLDMKAALNFHNHGKIVGKVLVQKAPEYDSAEEEEEVIIPKPKKEEEPKKEEIEEFLKAKREEEKPKEEYYDYDEDWDDKDDWDDKSYLLKKKRK
jgi:hypothetical protein